MAEKYFRSLEAFAHFLEQSAVKSHVTMTLLAKEASHVLYRNTRKVYGDNTKLAHLAQSTQDERVALGYTPNDPLLRTGELLRDHVEHFYEPGLAAAGTSEVINFYHEFGYVNHWTGTQVPARSTFRIGLLESQAEVAELAQMAVGSMLGFRPIISSIVAGGLIEDIAGIVP